MAGIKAALFGSALEEADFALHVAPPNENAFESKRVREREMGLGKQGSHYCSACKELDAILKVGFDPLLSTK